MGIPYNQHGCDDSRDEAHNVHYVFDIIIYAYNLSCVICPMCFVDIDFISEDDKNDSISLEIFGDVFFKKKNGLEFGRICFQFCIKKKTTSRTSLYCCTIFNGYK